MGVQKFEDSLEATEFVGKIKSMLNDERLAEWATSTDNLFGTESAMALQTARAWFDAFNSQLENAE